MSDEKKVLLADDEESIRALVAATMRADGRYRFLEARNGKEALEIVLKEKPDLVILDVRMPEVDGFEVCRRLKANPETENIPVIMLSALTQESDRERGKHARADGYFTKPFSPTGLIKKVEEFLAG
jgi:CheY-like chemotaxis protein